MIRDGQAFHFQIPGSLNYLRNTAHTIKQAKFGMDVKMSKHGLLLIPVNLKCIEQK
jgi:hypothetical protein